MNLPIIIFQIVPNFYNNGLYKRQIISMTFPDFNKAVEHLRILQHTFHNVEQLKNTPEDLKVKFGLAQINKQNMAIEIISTYSNIYEQDKLKIEEMTYDPKKNIIEFLYN